jgi:hypothetical protein
LNKNFKKLALSAVLALTISATFLSTLPVNAQVNVSSDTPVNGFDSTLQGSKWTPIGYYGFDKPTVTTGKLSVTCDGSTFDADGVTLSTDSFGYRAYSTEVNLKPNTCYVMSGYVRATNIETNPNHTKNRSPFGFSVRYDANKDQNMQKSYTYNLLDKNINYTSTSGWKKLDFHFISTASGDTTLDCHLGSYCYDTKGTVEFAGLTLKEDSSYKTVSQPEFVAAVPVSQIEKYSISDTKLDNWGYSLNSVKQRLKELTGKKIGISQIFMNNDSKDDDNSLDFAYAGIPCIFSTALSEFTMQNSVNQDAVELGTIHEISHTYNQDYNRVWNFDDEVFTNVRAAYAAIEDNMGVVCYPDTNVYRGMEYKRYYDSLWTNYELNTEVNKNGYDQKAMCAIYLRMVYGDSSAGLPPLGWDVFKKFFSNKGDNPDYIARDTSSLPSNVSDDFKVFYSGLDIIAQISGKSIDEIIRYIPDGFYYKWYYSPSQYHFKHYDANDPNNIK